MKLIWLLLMTLTPALTKAQIPNSSFENWNDSIPAQWSCPGNSSLTPFIADVANAHDGTHAVQLSVLQTFPGVTACAPFMTGTDGSPVYTSSPPLAVHGWFLDNCMNADFATVWVVVTNATGAITGQGSKDLHGSGNNYNEFSVNIIYPQGAPSGDSLQLTFTIQTDTLPLTEGSNIILDDLSFGLPTNVIALTMPQSTFLAAPNPASDQFNISFTLLSTSFVSVSLFDAVGKMIQSFNPEKLRSGTYNRRVNVANLPQGIYYCRLQTGDALLEQKVIVTR